MIIGGDGNLLEYFFIYFSIGVIVFLKLVKLIFISNFRSIIILVLGCMKKYFSGFLLFLVIMYEIILFGI